MDHTDHIIDAVFGAVRDTDPDVLESDELDAFLRRVADLKSWCDSRQILAVRRQRELAAAGRAGEPTGSLSNHGRQSSKEAADAAAREETCTALPSFEDALAAGDVSAGHVDAISQATRQLDEEERAEFIGEAESLLAEAKGQSVDRFTKGCRDLAKSIRARHNARSDVDELEQQRKQSKISRWVDKSTGMHKTLIECDPVTDRIIWTGIQRERARLRRQQQRTGHGTKAGFDRLQVDALAAALANPSNASSRSGGADGNRPTLVVHIDLETLTDGRHDRTLCETDSGVPVPVETTRRLACEADIIPVVLDGRGVVLDEGRARRLATPEQRRAIEAMQSTCSHPDCNVTIDDCRIHHLEPWTSGGRTDLDSMAPVCESHHHLVHEGGWSFTMSSDRTATWFRPDGEVYWTGSLLDRRAVA
jgi:hypothetical protein